LPKDPNEIGALWSKQGKRGEYLTGTIGGQPVVLFRNEHATAANKQPVWRVLKSEPKGGPASTAPAADIPF